MLIHQLIIRNKWPVVFTTTDVTLCLLLVVLLLWRRMDLGAMTRKHDPEVFIIIIRVTFDDCGPVRI